MITIPNQSSIAKAFMEFDAAPERKYLLSVLRNRPVGRADQNAARIPCD